MRTKRETLLRFFFPPIFNSLLKLAVNVLEMKTISFSRPHLAQTNVHMRFLLLRRDSSERDEHFVASECSGLMRLLWAFHWNAMRSHFIRLSTNPILHSELTFHIKTPRFDSKFFLYLLSNLNYKPNCALNANAHHQNGFLSVCVLMNAIRRVERIQRQLRINWMTD